MKRSETIGKLAEALCKAQSEFSPAPYDAKNPHFNSRYASLSSVIEATKPMYKHGLSATQSLEIVEGRVNVTTLLLHTSGEWIEATISMKPLTDTPQNVGSAATYGRRYGLSAMLGICSDDDDDGNGTAKPNPPKQSASKTAVMPKEPAKPDPTLTAGVAATAANGSQTAEKSQEKPVSLPVSGSVPAASVASSPNNSSPQKNTTAEEISLIRSLVIELGIKTREDYLTIISTHAGRAETVKDPIELSPAERKSAIDKLKIQVAEKKEGEATNG